MALITIGITAYNAFDTIDRAIKSAINQSYPLKEIIVVDDFSSDGTLEVLRRACFRYPTLRVFQMSSNGGVAIARNLILEKARGEFVVFFDDDDESDIDRVLEQHKRLAEYERDFAGGAPVVCHTVRKIIYPNEKERIERTIGLVGGRKAPCGIAVAKRILLGFPLEDGYGSCPTCCQMARLATYRELGGFDPSLRRGEDTDFNIRLALVGGHFVGVDKPLVVQTMTKTSDKSLRDEHFYWHRIFLKHRSILEAEGQFHFSLAWLDLKQSWLERNRLKFILRFLKIFTMSPVLTFRRLYLALPNIGSNNEFSSFHFSKND